MTIYAIPDVHGHLDKLERAHALIAADRVREGASKAPVVHLGDLNDRGPDTRGVIDRLVGGIGAGEPWIVLMGNHDRMFRNFLRAERLGDAGRDDDAYWLHPALGGVETLASYGVRARGRRLAEVKRDAAAAVPEAHRVFLEARPLWHVTEELVFVHAGIRPGVPLEAQTEEDLVWIREPFLYDLHDHGRLVVHGHTPVREPEHHGNRVALDAGAAFGGPLVAAVFEGRQCWLLGPRGREPLRPF
ncbi:metallophosphoesterase [Roseitranquillus sediminis]|uniref:metallophosphoesterase n=1 Tax=Roseitranquillus sediminis TaxID=2809051 RepID=UPI001D0C91ED|nr:metallophosphoesterase [Roseitranquillus sediminis]MBM9593500.1 metallophosphoesterase [Roseitranquillus sediminis]